MKTNLLIATIILGTLSSVVAQYKPVGDDGIAASPKLRERLSNTIVSAPGAAGYTVITASDGVLASPKLRQTLNAQKKTATPETTALTSHSAMCAGYKVAATPRMQQLWPEINRSCCGTSSCMLACNR